MWYNQLSCFYGKILRVDGIRIVIMLNFITHNSNTF
jgi:hypothetical protein